jgi:hypothetical protein
MAKNWKLKLSLNKEAIKNLAGNQLGKVGGGLFTAPACPDSIIMTCTSHGG